MAITAAMVKELRERTGAGMMECKKALSATDGDMELAIENLRKTGLAKADKKAGRTAAEGVISMAITDDCKKAVMVEINSETDFVAKDDNFGAFSKKLSALALDKGVNDVEALLAAEYEAGQSVEEARQVLIAKVGENIQVRRMVAVETNGIIGAYVHGNKIGVFVEQEGGTEELAKDLAMHVAAINPAFTSVDDVPADVVEKEKRILVDQARDSGKPEEIIEKMIQGRLRKFLAEITLLGQPFVKDNDVIVEKLLKQNDAKVHGFQRLAVGEGIEKKEENFAEEVMSQVKGG